MYVVALLYAVAAFVDASVAASSYVLVVTAIIGCDCSPVPLVIVMPVPAVRLAT